MYYTYTHHQLYRNLIREKCIQCPDSFKNSPSISVCKYQILFPFPYDYSKHIVCNMTLSETLVV